VPLTSLALLHAERVVVRAAGHLVAGKGVAEADVCEVVAERGARLDGLLVVARHGWQGR
jgi:hypothetical protein